MLAIEAWVQYVSLANFLLLVVLAVLGLWIKDKFFTPLRIDMIKTTAELRKSIAEEQTARKLELVAMSAAIREQNKTSASLQRAVSVLEQTSRDVTERFGASVVALAQEQGRLAEREHFLSTEITAVKLRQDERLRHTRRADDKRRADYLRAKADAEEQEREDLNLDEENNP